jgi:hypothetical protein
MSGLDYCNDIDNDRRDEMIVISQTLAKLSGFYSITQNAEGISEIATFLYPSNKKITADRLVIILERLRSSSTAYKDFTLKLWDAMLQDPNAIQISESAFSLDELAQSASNEILEQGIIVPFNLFA